MSNLTPSERLFTAIRAGDPDVVTQLAKDYPDVLRTTDDRGSSPLVLSTYLGDLPVTRALVEAGAPIDARGPMGNTALMGVSFRGHVDIVRFLIERGADVNLRNEMGGTAVTFAGMSESREVIEVLRAAGAE